MNDEEEEIVGVGVSKRRKINRNKEFVANDRPRMAEYRYFRNWGRGV